MSKEFWNVEINRGAGYIKTYEFWADGWVEACRGRLVQFQSKPVISFATTRINYMTTVDPPKPKPKPEPKPEPKLKYRPGFEQIVRDRTSILNLINPVIYFHRAIKWIHRNW